MKHTVTITFDTANDVNINDVYEVVGDMQVQIEGLEDNFDIPYENFDCEYQNSAGKCPSDTPVVEEMALIHYSDHNMQYLAYEFPMKLMKELHDLCIKAPDWKRKDSGGLKPNPKAEKALDFFRKHFKAAKGIEDADVFLDWGNLKESASEWDDYFTGSEGWNR